MKARLLAALAAATLALCAGRVARAQAAIHYNTLPQTVDFNGDSITAAGGFNWPGVSGGFIDQVNAQIQAHVANQTGGTGSNSGGRPIVSGNRGSNATFTFPATINAVNTGVSNYSITDLLNTIPTHVTPYQPNVLITMVGVNDMVDNLNSTNPQTTPAGFRVVYDQYLDAVVAASPSSQNVCLSIWEWKEQYTLGPPLAWANGISSYDTVIPQYNAQIQQSCQNHGGTYVDLHAQALVDESVNNTPPPGSNSFYQVGDAIHPSTLGRGEIGNTALTGVTVVP